MVTSDPPAIKGKAYVRTTYCLAIAQIVLGSLTCLAGFSLFLYGNRKEFEIYGGYGLSGILGGVWYIVTGILGLASSRRPSNFIRNNTHMAFTMSAIFVVLFSVAASAICIRNLNGCFKKYYGIYPRVNIRGIDYYCEKKRTAKAFAWLMLIFNIFELFVAFAASVFTCLFYGACCKCCLHCCVGGWRSDRKRTLSYDMSYQTASAPPQTLPYNPNFIQQSSEHIIVEQTSSEIHPTEGAAVQENIEEGIPSVQDSDN